MKHSISGRLSALAVSTAMLAGTLLPGVTATAAEEENFARLLQYSMTFYDANMCGTGVDENSLLSWRGDCHTYDAEVPLKPMGEDNIGTNLSQSFIDEYKDILDPDGDGCVDVSGGFHDAGDHVEFGMPENYAASTLGWGYYEFRDAYEKSGQDTHIETILRYFNDYLMRCTFLDENGDVIAHCYQVGDGDIDHAYWQSPEVDSMARPAFFLTVDKPQTDYVASAAASLAINYLNFKDTDPEYAQQSLDYATALFRFAMEHPKELSDNADGPKGYYRSSKWEDDYCWAAAWLYKITGDHTYLEEIYPNYDYYAAPSYVHCWNDVWGGVQCILGEITEETPAKEGEHVYPDFIEEYKVAAEKSPYEEMDPWASVEKAVNGYMSGNPGTLSPQGYWWMDTWGSARYNTAGQLVALVYDKYNGAGKFSEWAKEQMEYLLGDNETTFLETAQEGEDGAKSGSRCYVVGYKESSAKYPHHRASSGLTKCEDPSPQRHVLYGALVGGPDADDAHNDITKDYIYNEVTIDYNAAFVGAAAGLYHFFGKDTDKPDADFPPVEESSGDVGGGNGYWIEAFAVDDLHDDGAGVTKISFMVRTDSNKPSDKITVRYFFSSEEIANIASVECKELYDQSNAEEGDNGADGICSGPFKYDKMDDIYYVEITWDGYKIANSGKKYQFSMGMYYGDQWDPTNDYSYQGLPVLSDTDMFADNNEVKTDYICVYDDGVLVGGIEPDGSVPDTQTPSEPASTEATEQPSSEPASTEDTYESDTSGSGSASEIIYGDVDCDGEVKMVDMITLNKYLMIGTEVTEQGLKNADVNRDGEVAQDDGLNILRAVIDLITLPVS